MKQSQVILESIKNLQQKDKSYNNFINEGGEGYEIESPELEDLHKEYVLEKQKEFNEEWTREVFEERRKKVNDLKLNMIQMIKFKQNNGWGYEELMKAKKMYDL